MSILEQLGIDPLALLRPQSDADRRAVRMEADLLSAQFVEQIAHIEQRFRAHTGARCAKSNPPQARWDGQGFRSSMVLVLLSNGDLSLGWRESRGGQLEWAIFRPAPEGVGVEFWIDLEQQQGTGQ